ncbi:MAG: hypothetical protein KGL39_56805 [Patescibacteria group bacterium]|nr:hypothetical protein [Patescibacteria group bacterium]
MKTILTKIKKHKPARRSWLGLSVNDWPKSALLALPHRKWNNDRPRYDSLLILSTGKKHESGWAKIAIIGVKKQNPVEVCTVCSDDIEWILPPAKTFGPNAEYSLGQFRTDCAIKSGALHVWCQGGKFRVGESLSSTAIELFPNL